MEKIFEINIITASFSGLILGSVNGVITGYFLKKYIKSDNRKFFLAFFITFIYRLLFLVFSVWNLRDKKVIIILLYSFFLILFQILVEIIFLKSYGAKRNT
jgi:hypothetical protein